MSVHCVWSGDYIFMWQGRAAGSELPPYSARNLVGVLDVTFGKNFVYSGVVRRHGHSRATQ